MSTAQIFIDYDTLRILWWAILGILLIGFALLGGFDLGVGILLPFVAKSDTEKRILLNSIGPTWEGNQVWFILGGGAVFAAWPLLYAVAFSGFYFAMLLVLAALILRPVGFDYRNKLEHKTWRKAWDVCLFLGGLVPALVFGIAFGNLFEGVPFRFDPFMRIIYLGNFFDLLNPFALLVGIISVLMLALHGAAFLLLKTEDAVAERARNVAMYLPVVLVACLITGAWCGLILEGYTDVHGTIFRTENAWLHVYARYPLAIIVLELAMIAPLCAGYFAYRRQAIRAFLTTSVTVACIIANAGVALFPFLLPSSLDPQASLTVWNASSSHLTLFIMLLVTLVFMPLIGSYTIWAYYKMRGRVTAKDIETHSHTLY